jgi:hypothetical protein
MRVILLPVRINKQEEISMFSIIAEARQKALFLMLVSAAIFLPDAWSQSTDFSRPTPISSVPVVGEHDGSQGISRYYGFEAGPGDILVTFDGHASRYSTTADARLYDANRNLLASLNLLAKTSPSSITKRITLAKRQRLVLETSLAQDTSMGVLNYSLNVSGPSVKLARETPSSEAPDTVATAPPIARASRGTKLHIEMRDGSTHDFDMSTIRRLLVE